MKKILSILTTVGLIPTLTIPTIACNNTNHKTSNNANKEQKEKEEQERNVIKEEINSLLSNLEWEFKDGSVYMEDKNSNFNFTIVDKNKDGEIRVKSYALSEDLTKSKRDEATKLNAWNTVEIKTAFANTALDIPTNKELEEDSKIEINDWDWSYGLLTFVEGNIEVKPKATNVSTPIPRTLHWKMGYLSKESYYRRLFNLGINYYFNSAHYYDREKRPYPVQSGFEFDDKWINDVILNHIAKGNKNFAQELMRFYKGVELKIIKERKDDPGMWDEVIGKTWNHEQYPYSQRVIIAVNFINGSSEWVHIYLQPE